MLQRFHSADLFHKRLPFHPPATKTDLYVTRRRNPAALYQRAYQLLVAEGEREIRIHGLGAAINTAVELALEVWEPSAADELQIVRVHGILLLFDRLKSTLGPW